MIGARPGPLSGGPASLAFRAPVPARQGWREAVRVWWSELDRVLLLLILSLMAIGVTAVLAASPASADQLSTSSVTLDPF